jgi:hypothetical protein
MIRIDTIRLRMGILLIKSRLKVCPTLQGLMGKPPSDNLFRLCDTDQLEVRHRCSEEEILGRKIAMVAIQDNLNTPSFRVHLEALQVGGSPLTCTAKVPSWPLPRPVKPSADKSDSESCSAAFGSA